MSRFFFSPHSRRNAKGDRIGLRSIARHITERKRTDKAQRESGDSAKRLAQENVVVAEIGRIISSSLNIGEVYERFAEEVRKLIPFDRIVINIINPEENTTTISYVTGVDIPGLRVGDTISLFGTVTEKCIRSRSSLLIQTEDLDKLADQFPGLLPALQAGLRSMIFVPLISKDQVIGVLLLQLKKMNAYSVLDLDLAESISTHIAGAIANAQLFKEHKRAEEALRQGERFLTSIFASIRDGISILDNDLNIIRVNPTMEKWHSHALPLIGKKCYEVYHNRNERCEVCPSYQTIQTGKQAYEIISRRGIDGKTIRWLDLFSFPFTDIETGKVKGVIEYVRDITERKWAEEALQRSEEAAKRLAQENAIVAEIGRIISSTWNINEIYERFAEEAHKLIPFDRIAISIINPKNNTITTAYVIGLDVAGRRVGDVSPLAGTATEEVMRTRSSLLIQTEDPEEIIGRCPGFLPSFQSGFRSMMSAPLISRDQVIGALHLQSTKPNAYSERDLRLIERVSNQIAGATANAQLFIERKKVEEALRESEIMFQELFDEAPVGYHEMDTEGRVTRVNRTEQQMLGYTAEEMLGQPVWKFIFEEEMSRQSVRAKIAGIKPPQISFERNYRRKDGSIIPVLMEERLLKDREGRIVGIRSTQQDITERKRAEEGLRKAHEMLEKRVEERTAELSKANELLEQEIAERKRIGEARARLATIVESSGDAIIGKDLDGSILSWNSGAERIYGYTAEEIIGKSISILVPPDYPNEVLEILERIKKGEGIENYETVRMRKDGRRIDVSLTVSPIKDDTGKIMGASAIARDITERKQMQEKLLISERLATLGLFSGSISHELKNPLSTIDSSVYYLKTKLKDADEKVRTHLDRIKSSVGSTLAIIDSLRNLTQIKEPRLERLDLISITFDAIANFEVPGTVNVIRNIREQEVFVNADPEQLKMAFKNIVNNAIQAMDGKGTLEVTVRKIDDQAEVSFTDTGPGIAPENLDKIFQPLFSTKAKGLGFGLSIAKMIFDKHSGTIEAKSEQGKGATILIHFPLYIQS